MKVVVYQKTAFYKGMYILEKEKHEDVILKDPQIIEHGLSDLQQYSLNLRLIEGRAHLCSKERQKLTAFNTFLDTRIKMPFSVSLR